MIVTKKIATGRKSNQDPDPERHIFTIILPETI